MRAKSFAKVIAAVAVSATLAGCYVVPIDARITRRRLASPS